jgi:putative intracellular protease/amidase
MSIPLFHPTLQHYAQTSESSVLRRSVGSTPELPTSPRLQLYSSNPFHNKHPSTHPNSTLNVMAVVPKSLGLLIFPQFETLDTYGPIGLIATRVVKNYYNVTLISTTPIPLSTCQIPTLAQITLDIALTQKWDVVLLPGGIGFEQLLKDPAFLTKLNGLNEMCEVMFTVCTGSFTLAGTGLLDGVRATSNKALFCEWTMKFPKVDWVHKARWVHDGKYLSSSGISAGMVRF